MEWANFIAVVQQYIDPAMLIVIVACWVLGFFMKNTPRFEDWMIIWVLTLFGIVCALLILGFTIHAVIQGILAAGIAVYVHQLIKQTKKAKD